MKPRNMDVILCVSVNTRKVSKYLTVNFMNHQQKL